MLYYLKSSYIYHNICETDCYLLHMWFKKWKLFTCNEWQLYVYWCLCLMKHAWQFFIDLVYDWNTVEFKMQTDLEDINKWTDLPQ